MIEIIDNENIDAGRGHIPYVFIISYNRPIYLWLCLDSVYKKNKNGLQCYLN